jgi:neutral ceramidase
MFPPISKLTIYKNKLFRGFLWVLAGGFVLAASILSPIDRAPSLSHDECQKGLENWTNAIPTELSSDTFQVGWSKVSITPNHPVALAGYGRRPEFTGIHDSLYVRALVLKMQGKEMALINVDLLIFPPVLEQRIVKATSAWGWSRGQLYFTATHTHHGIGGWAQGIGPSLLAGGYSDSVVDFLEGQIMKALQKARADCGPAVFDSEQYAAPDWVDNRLVGKAGLVDNKLRCMFFKKENGASAVWMSYAAHPTCGQPEDNLLSADYPGLLCEKLEEKGYDWACYSAGAVGSHGPTAGNVPRGVELKNKVAAGLFATINADTIQQWKKVNKLSYASAPIAMPPAQMKLAENWRIRPWVFGLIMGQDEPEIQEWSIDSLRLVGLPCDFSGELAIPLYQKAKTKGNELYITSFSGGYVGYITPDGYYDFKKSETRSMNWFGPGNGVYFSELVKASLSR